MDGSGLLQWRALTWAYSDSCYSLWPNPMDVTGWGLLQQRKSLAQACSNGCPFHYIFIILIPSFYSHQALGFASFPLRTWPHYLSTHRNFIVCNLYLSLLWNLSQQLPLSLFLLLKFWWVPWSENFLIKAFERFYNVSYDLRFTFLFLLKVACFSTFAALVS